MTAMHTELSSFLADVWENRDYILFGCKAGSSDTGEAEGDTVGDRIYCIYAPNSAYRASTITPGAYDTAVSAFKGVALAARWRPKSARDGFHVFQAPEVSSPSYRLYLNVKPERVVAVAQELVKCAVFAEPPPFKPTAPTAGTAPKSSAPVLDPRVLPASALARMKHHNFADVMVAFKVADKEEAFTNRPDRVVVYLNDLAGTAGVGMLVSLLKKNEGWYLPDTPPLTKRLAWGMGCGPEVSSAQWAIGNSFGMLRCNLIAHALVEVVTGRQPVLAEQLPAPLPKQPPRPPVGNVPGHSPNRLDFMALVSKLFLAQGLNPNAPWA
jgi:hypothetical protein